MRWYAAIAAAAVGGCSLAAGLGDYREEVAGAGGGGVNADGGATGCVSSSDCPYADISCRVPTCEQGVCGLDYAPSETSCFGNGGDQCDGAGNCVKEDGKPCFSGAECLSDACSDEVCCESVCDQACEACDLSGSVGVCLPIMPAEADPLCGAGVCDGSGSCASGDVRWGHVFGESGDQFAGDVTIDAQGNIYLTGTAQGVINFGGGTFTTDGSDLFVAAFDNNGNHLFSKVWVLPDTQRGNAIAVDSAGAIIVAGDYIGGSVDFGDGHTVFNNGGGQLSVFVVKLALDGSIVWASDFLENNDQLQSSADVAVDSQGDIWLTGRMRGGVDFGVGSLFSATDSRFDVFLVKLDGSTGNAERSAVYGDSQNDQNGAALAVDGSDGVVLVGQLRSPLDIEGIVLTGLAGNNPDVFVAKFDTTGAALWAKAFTGGAGPKLARDVAVDDAGNIAIVGRFETTRDIDGNMLMSTQGSEDMFVVMLDSSGGYRWAKPFGDAAGVGVAEGVGFDAAGNLMFAGNFEGSLSFGGDTHDNPTMEEDVGVTKLAPDGTHLWSHFYGDGAWQYARALAVGPGGDVAVAGDMKGTIVLPNDSLTATDGGAFVMSLAP